jgi:arginine deiminase
MMSFMQIDIQSEIGHLKRVITHTPGREVSLVNPEIKEELLFDDIIFEDDARKEHIDMLEMFRCAMPDDGEIIEILDLAKDVFETIDGREFFIESLVKSLPEKNIFLIENTLKKLSAEELVRFVVEGSLKPKTEFNLWPLPNLLFTRDLAAVAGNNIILSKAAKKARVRESLLMEVIVRYHTLFEGVKENVIQIEASQTIEGGDVMVVNEKIVLIGLSERSSFSGLLTITEKILKKGIEFIVAVDIPKKRASMHLDTIFTFTDKDECVVFPPYIEEQRDNVVVLSKHSNHVSTRQMPSLKSALEELCGYEYNFIKCGGQDPTDQYREQWTDGANIFALAPGVIVGYERNSKTFNELIEQGYRYMNQYEFIEEYSDKAFKPEEEGKIAITFQGHELCRGRGGARCMTLPLLRAKLN